MEDDPVDPVKINPLYTKMYPCEYKVPLDPTTGGPVLIDGYDKITNSTCTYCTEVCPKASVDDHINFFDGMDKHTVGSIYAIFLVLTFLW